MTRPWDQRKFDEWKESVASIVERRTGMSLSDLPDCSYADWFQQGVTPKGAANRAIKEAGGEGLV